MNHWWRVRWRMAVVVGLICCAFNFMIIGRPHPLTWMDWIKPAADDAIATAVFDFVLVRNANFQQRIERVSLAQALLTAVFAGLFTQALIMAFMNAGRN